MTWRASDKTTENLPRPDRPFRCQLGNETTINRSDQLPTERRPGTRSASITSIKVRHLLGANEPNGPLRPEPNGVLSPEPKRPALAGE
jgi:hypothetical protein